MCLSAINPGDEQKEDSTDGDTLHEEPIITCSIERRASFVLIDPGVYQRSEDIAQRYAAEVKRHDEGLQSRRCLGIRKLEACDRDEDLGGSDEEIGENLPPHTGLEAKGDLTFDPSGNDK